MKLNRNFYPNFLIDNFITTNNALIGFGRKEEKSLTFGTYFSLYTSMPQ
jgi:hypothetical protein